MTNPNPLAVFDFAAPRSAVAKPQAPAPVMPLGTADWRVFAPGTEPGYRAGDLFVGRLPSGSVLGINDKRHVLICGGTRGGKGTSIVVPNLIGWPGSVVVLDPKGENAMVTARRRGKGSMRCKGYQQRVYILDPLREVRTDEDDFADVRVGYNPMDAVLAAEREAVDTAGRIADALIVSEASNDPFWEESARALLRAIILHVASWKDIAPNDRNLVTVRRLVLEGKAELRRMIAMNDPEGRAPSAHSLLFAEMGGNRSYGGAVSGAGEWFGDLARNGERTFISIMTVALTNTDFIDGEIMRDCLTRSGFALKDIKTDPRGVSLYLVLPQRYMGTHFRWLRMMVTLIVDEMERQQGTPATGHPLLMVLDEFAALKRMRAVENAAAQIAGFGVKMVFVVQTLAQMKDTYRDNWETLVANAGTRIFFCNDDQFTRDYASKLVGDIEVVREGRSHNATRGSNTGTSEARSIGSSVSFTEGVSISRNGGSYSASASVSQSVNETRTQSQGYSHSQSAGVSESIQKRPLITPDEVGRLFGNPRDPAALVLVSGQQPIAVRRVEYFHDKRFRGLYDAHRDHPRPPTLLDISMADMQAAKEAKMRAAREAEDKRRADAQKRAWAAEQVALAREKAAENARIEALKAEGRRGIEVMRLKEARQKKLLKLGTLGGISGFAALKTGGAEFAWSALLTLLF
jgi:type IV secretory pathway TraG/TraD family ATPase VirD4